MSQPHPPIPEPQPQPLPDQQPLPGQQPLPDAQPHPGHAAGDEDDPRTQSILLPPSQRQAEPVGEQPPSAQPAPWAPPVQPPAGGPAQPATGPITAQPAGGGPFAGQSLGTQVTGPVDFVPGLGADGPPVTTAGSSAAPVPGPPTLTSGPGTSPGMPASTPRRSPLAGLRQAGRGGTALLTLGLGVLGLALLQVGLALDFGTRSLWDVVPTWSVFATLAAVVVVAPAVAGLAGRGLPARTAWRVGAVGLVALAAFWVLVALPVAASDRGFWLTAALAAAGAATWLAPGRPE